MPTIEVGDRVHFQDGFLLAEPDLMDRLAVAMSKGHVDEIERHGVTIWRRGSR
jgi:hypothetical protein